jgi:branched-chain amino acid transport system substrate-binding protein
MKVRAKGAQVILPIFDMPQSGTLVKKTNPMKVPALLGGFISPLAGPGAWKTFDAKIGGAINCNFEMGSGVFSDKVAKSKVFAEAYEKRWGGPVEAGHGISPAYESVYLLAEAIARAGSLDADAIVAALEKTDRAGVMGRIKFDEGHQVVYDMDPAKAAVAAVLQWNNDGSRTIVFPPSIADGEIKLPAGLKPVK